MDSVIVDGICKAYKIYPNKFSRMQEWLSISGKQRHEKKWILEDISFSVASGEAVGIVGMNGAGKSTLLKIITGTTSPTKGKVEMRGKVAALLELGMGFHGDFSGRQNVYMAGQLLGLTVQEISDLMPEIEEFAEIGSYIDQPVRVYSSGMQVRLAFSLATAVRPDVLIVDEALSVGDAYFQHKSFERIKQYRELGTTLLIVSHDKAAIQAVCDKAILLDSGKIIKEGKPESVMDFYNALIANHSNEQVTQHEDEAGNVQTISGNKNAEFSYIGLHDASTNRKVDVIHTGQKVKLILKIDICKNIDSLVCGIMIKDRLGQAIFGINSHALKKVLKSLRSRDKYEFIYEFDANLGEGNYAVSIALHEHATHVSNNYEWIDIACTFEVINTNKPTFVGSNWLDTELKIVKDNG